MNNTLTILKGIEYVGNSRYMGDVIRALKVEGVSETAMADAHTMGQLRSKKWLVDNLPQQLNLGVIFICAGWYGTLANMIMSEMFCEYECIRNFDIDPSCAAVADALNHTHVVNSWQFKASTLDIHDMTYPLRYTTLRGDGSEVQVKEMPNTIINTSCEHIENFSSWYKNIPAGTLVVLQSNNYYEVPEHINCVDSVDDFKKMAPMSQYHYVGELELDKYKRFMLIGWK